MTRPSGPLLAWVDLEMTGLEPAHDVILQMALVITDLDSLEEIDSFEMVIFQPESVLDGMIPYVRAMHEKSGLINQVRRSPLKLEDLEQEANTRLMKYAGPKEAYLAGNSVWVDRTFLKAYMPTFEGLLHYRQVDVSSLKIMAQTWFGNRAGFPKVGAHTALDDIRESIQELKAYRSLFGGGNPPRP